MEKQYFELLVMGVESDIYNVMCECVLAGAMSPTGNKFEYKIEGMTNNIMALTKALKNNHCTIVH